MRRFVPALVAALLILALASTAVLAANTTFSVNLKGENELTGGDLDANGQAHLELLPDTDMVCYTLKWTKVDGLVSGAHIHVGAAGVDGGIVVTLFGGPLGTPTAFPGDRFTTSNCVTADGAVIDAILANPTNYYVNVHTGADFHGVIRGQLK
jgi:CHRD domain